MFKIASVTLGLLVGLCMPVMGDYIPPDTGHPDRTQGSSTR